MAVSVLYSVVVILAVTLLGGVLIFRLADDSTTSATAERVEPAPVPTTPN